MQNLVFLLFEIYAHTKHLVCSSMCDHQKHLSKNYSAENSVIFFPLAEFIGAYDLGLWSMTLT